MNLSMPLVAVLLMCVGTPAGAVDCQENLPPSNPDAVYQDYGNGRVVDTRSGLMWKRCSEGQSWDGAACNGTAGYYTWAGALAQADASSFAGHTDWRLPNVKELSDLVEECREVPAINNTVFPNTPREHYWSASPHANESSHAWYVSFGYGHAVAIWRVYGFAVRLVRGGQ
jgi:hypothetical protein